MWSEGVNIADRAATTVSMVHPLGSMNNKI